MPDERELTILIKAKDMAGKTFDEIERRLAEIAKRAERFAKAVVKPLKNVVEILKKLVVGLDRLTKSLGNVATNTTRAIKEWVKLLAVFRYGIPVAWKLRNAFLAIGVALKAAVGYMIVFSKTMTAKVIAGVFLGLKATQLYLVVLSKMGRKYRELQDLATELNVDTQELSKSMYGFAVSPQTIENARILGNLMEWWDSTMKSLITRTKEFAWNMALKPFTAAAGAEGRRWLKERFKPLAPEEVQKYLAEMRKFSDALTLPTERLQANEYKRILKEMAAVHEKFNIDIVEYDRLSAAIRKRLREDEGLAVKRLTAERLRLEGNLTEALKIEWQIQKTEFLRVWDENGKVAQAYEKNIRKRQQLERWNFLQLKSHTERMFTDLFVDSWNNKLRSAREIFRRFLLDIQREIAIFLAKRAVVMLFSRLMPVPSGTTTTGVPKSTLPSPSGTVGTGYHYQRGGWAGLRGPELAMLGEKEPELVIPKSKLGRGGGTTNNYYYISAVDAASFNDLIARNPDAIVAVTERAIQRNKRIRKTIKEFA